MESKKILKNASYLFVGNVGVRFISAVATILFARYSGAHEYGILSVALAFSSIVGYFTDAGLTQTFMRESMKKENDLGEMISSYLRVRIILSIIVTVLSLFFVQFFYHDTYLKSVIYWIVFPSIFGTAFQGVGIVYFQATERMQFTSGIYVLQSIANALVLFLAMWYRWPLIVTAALYGVGSILVGIISVFLVMRHTNIHRGWNNRILNELLAFTINGVILMIIPQLGPLVLEKVTSLKEVGYFSSAFRIPSVLYQIPGVIAAAFYPKLFAYGNANKHEEHRKLSNFELKLMSFLGLGVSLPFVLNPTFWITTLLGDEWIRAADALAVLSFMVVLQSINYPLADFLTTRGRQTKRTIIMCIGFVISFASYAILGKEFGMIGGAFSPILTEMVLLIGFCIFIPKGFNFLFKGIYVNILGFLISWSLYYVCLENLHPIVAFILIGIVYVLFVILFDKQIYQAAKKYIQSKSGRTN
jgi:O-antigen/teichoic acid export membrane protein